MNEIWGAGNFITNFIWEKRTNRENRKEISYRHDYILAYRKKPVTPDSSIKLLEMTGEALSRYKNPYNDPRGLWKSDPATAQSGHATPSQFYIVAAPNGKKHELPSGRCWVFSEEVMKEVIRDNRIWFGKDGNGVPRIKTYLDAKVRGLVPETIWFAEDVGTNESAKMDLKSMFEGFAIFQTPKPNHLIERILQIATTSNSIILDSFAGSGTTAHAVLNLNKQDGGNRKFILIEMEDYAETLTAERVRRVMAGYSNKEGTGGGFDFYTLGEPLFREDGLLNEAVGEAAIRSYVWHAETRSPAMVLSEVGPLPHPWLLGVHESTAWWFCYDRAQAVVLDIDLLSTILSTKAGETAVVYADYCTLPDDLMQARGIRFKKIPRDIPRL